MLNTTDQVQTFVEEREAIEHRFREMFDYPECPIEYGNVGTRINDSSSTSTPYKKKQFVRLNIIGGQVSTREVNRISTNVNGFININIFTAQNTGTQTALEIADKIYDIFNMVTFNGIMCEWASRTVVPPNNGWYVLNISIPYKWQRCAS